MSRLLLVVPAAFFAAAGTAGSETRPHVAVHPGVVRIGQHATIAVSSIRTRSLEVRLAGATDRAGNALPWRRLHRAGGVWTATLPAPALRGVYPIELRTGHGARPFRPGRVFLRTFARNTRARPPFDSAEEAVRWWVRAVIGARLVAVKSWARPAFDRRERRLHRLFVVAYSPPGNTAVRDRLGVFVEVFRDGYRARWRVLETSVAP